MSNVNFTLPAGVARWWNAVAAVAAKPKDRPTLAGVYVEVGDVWSPVLGEYQGVSMTATDSYRLLNVVFPLGSSSDIFGEGAVMLPASIKVGARSELYASWYTSEVVEHVGAAYGVGPEVRVATATGVQVLEGIAGQFPAWRNLIPAALGDGGPVDAFAVSPVRLGSMLEAIGKVTGEDSQVRFVSTSASKPCRFDVLDGGVVACGIIMPMRVPGGVYGHLNAEAVAS